MNESKTIKDVVEEVEKSSTTFEKTNTDLKRKFLKWNIEAFNMIASSVSVIEAHLELAIHFMYWMKI